MLEYEHGGQKLSGIRLDFSVNLNPLGMPDSVRRALRESIDSFAPYPDRDCAALRAALGSALEVSPEYILCGNGASDLILRICAALRPKIAATLTPTFSEYARCVRLFGGETRPIESAHCGDLAFICTPNNPTGRLAPIEFILQTLEHGIPVVVDECFIEFTDGQSALPYIARYPNLIVLRAFTKIYSMAGLRLGYIVCSDAKLLARIAAFGAEWNVSAPATVAGLAALSESDWIARTRSLVKAERGFMAEELVRRGIETEPSDANFLLCKSSAPLARSLRGFGIAVRDCSNFAGLDSRYFRIGLKTREENLALLEALDETLKIKVT
ncbi:MAG: aminotransferase class I/II-fold pyridoxal phosphate-dependent enzyme [Oscillospiraceae bacterium]|jgi:threonine-phosphate decarboxylase|nr:aminotransferase class I/II-fold pyridoxal phosphate-dependent enzyme [Oscillospiraceae bacterium]